MLDLIKNEIKNRLNISMEKSNLVNSKKYITFNLLKSKFFKNYVSQYIIPNQLIDDCKKLIEINFLNISEKQQRTKLEQILFIPTVLYNHIYHTSDEGGEISLYEKGYQLSKKLLTSVMSPHDLYIVKDLLIQSGIIQLKEWDDGYLYSIDDKRALRYALNTKYKNLNTIVIKNKYASRFELLIQNGLAFGEKRESVNEEYLPYNTFDKNLQYCYQKQMYFDKEQFFDLFEKKYPNAMKILNGERKTDEETYKSLSIAYSFFNSLNSHVFKCSESYGRIYMPFQCIQKDFRSCIRIGKNESIFELYDIKCCFVNLCSRIIKDSNKKNVELVNECNKILRLSKNDIYSEILKYNDIADKFSRKDIKKQIMKWLFSNKKERKFFMSSYIEMTYIDLYFKENFPSFYDKIINYETFTKEIIKNGEVVKKQISKLSSECFQLESDLMLGKIIPDLHKEYKNIPFISLHDAIFIPERFRSKSDEIKNKISQLIQRIKTF